MKEGRARVRREARAAMDELEAGGVGGQLRWHLNWCAVRARCSLTTRGLGNLRAQQALGLKQLGLTAFSRRMCAAVDAARRLLLLRT